MKGGDSGSPRWKEQGTLKCSGVLVEEAQLPSFEPYPFVFLPQSLNPSIEKFSAQSELDLPIQGCVSVSPPLNTCSYHMNTTCLVSKLEVIIFLLSSFITEPSVNE
jgi:hypothetical protein